MPCIRRWHFLLLAICVLRSARAEDPENADTERLRNIPPQLSQTGGRAELPGQAQARFFPFAASFSVNAGGNNAQSFSIAGSPDGIGLSQSSSHGSGANGNPGSFSASQSSSIAAGLNGISASDSNSFAANHPFYGPTAQANGNSFAVGQAAANAHGNVVNGQAASGAQSSVGGTHTQASSSANAAAALGGHNHNFARPRPDRPDWANAQPSYASGNNGDYYYNSQRKPSLTITVSDDRNRFGTRPSNGWYEVPDGPSREPWRRPAFCDQYNGWYRDPRCRGPKVVVSKPTYRPSGPFYFENRRDPRDEGKMQFNTVAASSSAQSGPGGLAIGQSSAQSQNSGNRGQPGSLTVNRVETSGNAQAHAQGAAASVNQLGRPGSLQATITSGHASANSRPGGSAQGSSVSSSSPGSSNTQIDTSSGGGGSAQGAGTAGSFVTFPGDSTMSQIIPQEYVRSKKPDDDQSDESSDPLSKLFTGLTDTVYDIFDI